MTARTVDLLAICRRHVDPIARPVGLLAGHADSLVLRVATRRGDVVVKAHRSHAKHRQEVNAYRTWTPALGPHAPRLIAAHPEPAAVVITIVPGQALHDATLTDAAQRDAYRQAGTLLAALHRAAPAGPPIARWLAEPARGVPRRLRPADPRRRARHRALHPVGRTDPVGTRRRTVHAPGGAAEADPDLESSRSTRC